MNESGLATRISAKSPVEIRISPPLGTNSKIVERSAIRTSCFFAAASEECVEPSDACQTRLAFGDFNLILLIDF